MCFSSVTKLGCTLSYFKWSHSLIVVTLHNVCNLYRQCDAMFLMIIIKMVFGKYSLTWNAIVQMICLLATQIQTSTIHYPIMMTSQLAISISKIRTFQQCWHTNSAIHKHFVINRNINFNQNTLKCNLHVGQWTKNENETNPNENKHTPKSTANEWMSNLRKCVIMSVCVWPVNCSTRLHYKQRISTTH